MSLLHRRIKVGLCGFTVAQASYPHHYGVVEIQHTFYEPPPDETLQRWRASLPAPFEFTIKAWQLITHASSSSTYRKMKNPPAPEEKPLVGAFRDSEVVMRGWRRTVECARILDATAILFQSPASFRATAEHVANLTAFMKRIERPPGIRLMWEPRGPSWPERTVKSVCEKLGLIHVVDPFVNRPTTTDPAYLRLHGISGAGHTYTDAQLRKLYQGLPDSGEVYVMFNNLPRVGDSKRFLAMLAQAG